MIKRIFFIGPMGVGKTTIGNILAKKNNKKFIDSDYKIELIFGMSITLIFKKYGEIFFRKLEIKIIKKIGIENNIVLALGGGSILSFIIRNFLKNKGIIIYFKINIKYLLLHKNFIKNRPLLKKKKIKFFLIKYLFNRNFFYKKNANFIIKIKKKNKFIIVKDIINLFKNNYLNYL